MAIDSIRYHLKYSLGLDTDSVKPKHVFQAVALSVREGMIDRLLATEKRYQVARAKRIHYLSMEFLVGRSLINNLYNLNLHHVYEKAIDQLGFKLEDIENEEPDAALGNGGLGRLAACFLDSMASLSIPGFGYGINYEFGLFKQKLDNGYQQEMPDNWQREKTPWQIERCDEMILVPVYGSIQHESDRQGEYNPMWLDWQLIIGVPNDMPIVGYTGNSVNYLRLFSARSSSEFNMKIFNQGDYFKAVNQKITTETVSKILYPSDSFERGRELRLIQEYFLVACSLRDILRQHEKHGFAIEDFPKQNAIQLNDTHPALAVVELMRILVDEYEIVWDIAWKMTVETFGYTNHTLLPEALEKWSIPLLEKVIPRHLQLIYEINKRFVANLSKKWPQQREKIKKMELVEDGEPKHVRMANLAIMGSHSVNGVAKLHSELIKKNLIPDFYALWPEKFNNKTNGITQRRWLLNCNPGLANLITETIGDDWIHDLSFLKKLETIGVDSSFQQQFNAVKKANKTKLCTLVENESHLIIDPDSLFDVQIKRIHEYKRQLLNILNVIHQYFMIVEDGKNLPWPKTYIFAGKAAPGYDIAKLIIKLINSVADVVNNEPLIRDQLKVVFIPDYRVTLAENIIPATELSEQISTAGKEASGTGNMKFILNGAVTIGTLDGANIEIRDEVGEENIYIFGHTSEQIQQMLGKQRNISLEIYNTNRNIKRVMDAIKSDLFCTKEPGLFKPIFEKLVSQIDQYFHLADLDSYINIQEKASDDYKNREQWTNKSILNVARSGYFSSDRTIMEYAKEIWDVKPVK
ncbi:MAG: glycogen/starch/alpha-glucan phosphorylase [Calditrichaeota bacterium]|nr:MAG: glycogen/starch/alpha-glucan phosphorylase [Calditrichota bacterium]